MLWTLAVACSLLVLVLCPVWPHVSCPLSSGPLCVVVSTGQLLLAPLVTCRLCYWHQLNLASATQSSYTVVLTLDTIPPSAIYTTPYTLSLGHSRWTKFLVRGITKGKVISSVLYLLGRSSHCGTSIRLCLIILRNLAGKFKRDRSVEFHLTRDCGRLLPVLVLSYRRLARDLVLLLVLAVRTAVGIGGFKDLCAKSKHSRPHSKNLSLV